MKHFGKLLLADLTCNFEANFFFLLKLWIGYVAVNDVYETFLLQCFIFLRLNMIGTLNKTNKQSKENSEKKNNNTFDYCEIGLDLVLRMQGGENSCPHQLMWFDSGFLVIHIWVIVYVCRYSHAAPREFFSMNFQFSPEPTFFGLKKKRPNPDTINNCYY